MPKLEALCACPFGVGVHPKGATFYATEHEARILEALSRAKRVPETTAVVEPLVTAAHEPVGSPEPAQDVTPVADPAAAPATPTAEAIRQKRKYERRDLTAEK